MFLVSKMRAAASRGELDRLVIDPVLAARKDEFIAMQMRQPQELDVFFTEIAEKLRGKRVFMIGTYNLMYDVAKAGLERGIKGYSPRTRRYSPAAELKGFRPARRTTWTSSVSSSASTASRRATASPNRAPSTSPAPRAAITCTLGHPVRAGPRYQPAAAAHG